MGPLSACALIAARQYGAIGRPQAMSAGLSPDAIDRLLKAGAWRKIHRRAYALWEAEEPLLQRLIAGCLWLGGGSAVSHRAAGMYLDLDGFDVAPLEFSTPGQCRPGLRSEERGLIVHRVRHLPRTDIEVRANIPVTSATRTLIDLGAVANPRQIELALESALRKGLTSLPALRRRLGQQPTRGPKHVGVLRCLLEQEPPVATESALETLVWRLLRDQGLPQPERQYEIVGDDGRFVARVDFAYPDHKVAIEADGYEFHSSREDWRRDRRRQNALAALGWTVYRVTWADLTSRGHAFVLEVAGLLAR